MSILRDKRIYLLGMVQAVIFLIALYALTFGYVGSVTSPEVLYSPVFHLALVVSSGWLFVVAVIIYMLNNFISLKMDSSSQEKDDDYREELEAVKAAKKDTEREYYRREIDEQSFRESMSEYYRKINELKNKLEEEE